MDERAPTSRRRRRRAAGQRLDAIRAGEAEDVVERKAEKQDDLPPGHPWTFTTPDDPFLPLSPELLAYLTPEELEQVRASHGDDPDGVVAGCLRWRAASRQ